MLQVCITPTSRVPNQLTKQPQPSVPRRARERERETEAGLMQSLLGTAFGAWAEDCRRTKAESKFREGGGRLYQRPTRLRKEFSLAWMSAGALKELRQLVSPLGLRRVTRPGKIIGALVRLAFLCEVGTLSWLTSELPKGISGKSCAVPARETAELMR